MRKVFPALPAGPHLGIEIRRIRELLHHHMAEVMKQRVLVNRILHFRYFDEVFQLKALHLKKKKEKEEAVVTRRIAGEIACVSLRRS